MMEIMKIEGAGRTQDRAADLVDSLIAVCLEKGDGVAFAAVLGCLDLAKHHIIARQLEQIIS